VTDHFSSVLQTIDGNTEIWKHYRRHCDNWPTTRVFGQGVLKFVYSEIIVLLLEYIISQLLDNYGVVNISYNYGTSRTPAMNTSRCLPY
jgi:hypothetical protein